jgi:septum formation protein
VLGADQTLALGDHRFTKPATLAAARKQLEGLSGRQHQLCSAAAIARENTIVFETVECARLTMRSLSKSALDAYLTSAGDRVMQSVGAYQLESLGVHLFEKIEGDHFSILGLPLLPLLGFFRSEGLLP